jgi:hypothetical protein
MDVKNIYRKLIMYFLFLLFIFAFYLAKTVPFYSSGKRIIA